MKDVSENQFGAEQKATVAKELVLIYLCCKYKYIRLLLFCDSDLSWHSLILYCPVLLMALT